MDERSVRTVMRELGVRLEDVARKTDIDMSYVGKQIRGDLPLQRRVQRALIEVLDRRAVAALPHVARILQEHDRPDAAEACHQLWERLGRPQPSEPGLESDGSDGSDGIVQTSPMNSVL